MGYEDWNTKYIESGRNIYTVFVVADQDTIDIGVLRQPQTLRYGAEK